VICYDRAWRRLWTRRFADPLADAETFHINAEGQLLGIGGRTTRIEDIQGQYMGLFKFTPPAWSIVEALLATLDGPVRDKLDVTGLLRRLLAGKELSIGTFATQGQWGEVDNPEDVALRGDGKAKRTGARGSSVRKRLAGGSVQVDHFLVLRCSPETWDCPGSFSINLWARRATLFTLRRCG
jgi:hypothetical protein